MPDFRLSVFPVSSSFITTVLVYVVGGVINPTLLVRKQLVT